MAMVASKSALVAPILMATAQGLAAFRLPFANGVKANNLLPRALANQLKLRRNIGASSPLIHGVELASIDFEIVCEFSFSSSWSVTTVAIAGWEDAVGIWL